ncbi:MAG: aldehyde dehydrogenase family protein, partial [Actinocrinis sp.]
MSSPLSEPEAYLSRDLPQIPHPEILHVVNPATEKVIVQLAATGRAETDAAVARAKAAFPAWRDLAPGDRARLLRRFAFRVDRDLEHL